MTSGYRTTFPGTRCSRPRSVHRAYRLAVDRCSPVGSHGAQKCGVTRIVGGAPVSAISVSSTTAHKSVTSAKSMPRYVTASASSLDSSAGCSLHASQYSLGIHVVTTAIV